MNAILKKMMGEMTGQAASKPARLRPQYPITYSFDADGQCIGEGRVEGAKYLNIIYGNHKIKVIAL